MVRQAKDIAGRVVAITGGARGIGRATAAALVQRGARVAIGDIDLALAEETATELGGGTIALELDVTRRDSFAAFLDDVEQALGPIDVLINNAGIMPVGRFLDEDDATAQRQIEINLHGVIYGSKLGLERMLPRQTGHLVNIASQAGKAGFPGVATYCATKHAVVGLSEALRGELRGSGVEVSVVMPAIVNTELTSGVAPARFVKNVEPEDVANAIVAALERPHFDVYVPKSAGVIMRATNFLPRSGREAIARALKADRVMLEADPEARRAYAERTAPGGAGAGQMAGEGGSPRPEAGLSREAGSVSQTPSDQRARV